MSLQKNTWNSADGKCVHFTVPPVSCWQKFRISFKSKIQRVIQFECIELSMESFVSVVYFIYNWWVPIQLGSFSDVEQCLIFPGFQPFQTFSLFSCMNQISNIRLYLKIWGSSLFGNVHNYTHVSKNRKREVKALCKWQISMIL